MRLSSRIAKLEGKIVGNYIGYRTRYVHFPDISIACSRAALEPSSARECSPQDWRCFRCAEYGARASDGERLVERVQEETAARRPELSYAPERQVR
jgi:hypothetical protein